MSPRRTLIYLRGLLSSWYPSTWGRTASAKVLAITRIVSSCQTLSSREGFTVYSTHPSFGFTSRTTTVCSPDEVRNRYQTSVAQVRNGPSRRFWPIGDPTRTQRSKCSGSLVTGPGCLTQTWNTSALSKSILRRSVSRALKTYGAQQNRCSTTISRCHWDTSTSLPDRHL